MIKRMTPKHHLYAGVIWIVVMLLAIEVWRQTGFEVLRVAGPLLGVPIVFHFSLWLYFRNQGVSK